MQLVVSSVPGVRLVYLRKKKSQTFLPEFPENILHVGILLLQVQVERSGLWEGLEDVCNHQHPGLWIYGSQLDDLRQGLLHLPGEKRETSEEPTRAKDAWFSHFNKTNSVRFILERVQWIISVKFYRCFFYHDQGFILNISHSCRCLKKEKRRRINMNNSNDIVNDSFNRHFCFATEPIHLSSVTFFRKTSFL